jgi:hypothetical protein
MVAEADKKMIGDLLFQAFIDSALEMGFQEIVWNRQIWSSARPVTHVYTGHDPRTGHIHAGSTREASQRTIFPASFLIRLPQNGSGRFVEGVSEYGIATS